jgi:hypothetical protein
MNPHWEILGPIERQKMMEILLQWLMEVWDKFVKNFDAPGHQGAENRINKAHRDTVRRDCQNLLWEYVGWKNPRQTNLQLAGIGVMHFVVCFHTEQGNCICAYDWRWLCDRAYSDSEINGAIVDVAVFYLKYSTFII